MNTDEHRSKADKAIRALMQEDADAPLHNHAVTDP
jgi:hypothetical protein